MHVAWFLALRFASVQRLRLAEPETPLDACFYILKVVVQVVIFKCDAHGAFPATLVVRIRSHIIFEPIYLPSVCLAACSLVNLLVRGAQLKRFVFIHLCDGLTYFTTYEWWWLAVRKNK